MHSVFVGRQERQSMIVGNMLIVQVDCSYPFDIHHESCSIVHGIEPLDVDINEKKKKTKRKLK
jgi:hypothetical protein